MLAFKPNEETKPYYFYLWRNTFLDEATDKLVTRTCLGITSNAARRIQGYEGHVGHTVKFAKLWKGPERLIRDLESKIKSDFYNHLFVGTGNYRYEWITEDIPFDSIVNWVNWETANTYIGIEEYNGEVNYASGSN